FGECFRERLKLGSGKGIEQCQTNFSIKRDQRFILRVNAGEVWRKLLQNRNRRVLVVDENSALGRRELTAQDQVLVFGIDAIVFQDLPNQLFGSAFHLEYRRDNRALGAETDDIR